MSLNGVIDLTAHESRKLLDRREVSSVELTQAFLDRIDLHEDHYNALISMNPDALAIAASELAG